MNEDDPLGDWFSRAGKTDFRVSWKMERGTRKFPGRQTPDGERDLGDEDLEGRSQQLVWQDLRVSNSRIDLEEFNEYQMFVGQNQIQRSDLPCPEMIFVPKVIPV
jgi:hypothetical protein